MNKNTTISIIFSIVLSIIYFSFFHKNKAFKDYSGIESILKIANGEARNAIKTNERLAFKKTDKKPSLHPHISEGFQGLDSIYTLLYAQKNIPFIHYDSIAQKMTDVYSKCVKNSQKEAKLRNDEALGRIKNFQQYALDSSILFHAINEFPNEGLFATNEALRQHILQSSVLAANDFLRLATGMSSSIIINYPVVISQNISVRKGEEFQVTLVVGRCTSDPKLNNKIFINGKQIQTNTEGKGRLSLPPSTRPGKQRIEMVLEWTNPNTKVVKRDSSFFEYWVLE